MTPLFTIEEMDSIAITVIISVAEARVVIIAVVASEAGFAEFIEATASATVARGSIAFQVIT